MTTRHEPIDHNHPAACNALYVHMHHFFPSEKDKSGRQKVAEIITAALPHLTSADLRDTPAGRALMAEALEEEAYRMDVVISNGDAAEQAAPAPGETGRGGAVTARDALYENPAQYLRDRADAYRTETPDE